MAEAAKNTSAQPDALRRVQILGVLICWVCSARLADCEPACAGGASEARRDVETAGAVVEAAA
jgi:hypothetical protein